jgi:hypothetical protein
LPQRGRQLLVFRSPFENPNDAPDVLIDRLPQDARITAWNGFKCGRSDELELIEGMAAVDPTGPAPEPAAQRRTAHLGDLAGANDARRFAWLRWIVRGHFTLLTSEPKVGKTRLMLELAKRLWFGGLWPDGQDATFPATTKTLWIAGDRQQDELREIAAAYGIPVGAVLLNADPEDPYGGVSLDYRDNVQALRERIEIERPGLVFIDTVWRATRRKLGREDEVNMLMDPLIAIAQDLEIALVGAMHNSRDGETLGLKPANPHRQNRHEITQLC